MTRHLPPLTSLRAFEAAARYLSFRAAAAELGVTPAAVSQSVKVLEDYLGVSLFVRTTRSIRLTAPAERALSRIRRGFDELHDSVQELRNASDRTILTISVSNSFGSRWLLPRIQKFQDLFPEIGVRIEVTNKHADFRHDGVDLALRCGRGVYRESLHSELLTDDIAFPICSPSLVRRRGCLSDPKAVLDYKLLHVNWSVESRAAPSWKKWLRHAGVEELNVDDGLSVTTDDMVIEAAIKGQGMAIATHALVIDDLMAGRLVKPFPDRFDMPTDFHHYIVCPKKSAADRKVAVFRQWAHGEIRAARRKASSGRS